MGMEQLRDKQIMLFDKEAWLKPYIERVYAIAVLAPAFPSFPTEDVMDMLNPDAAIFHVKSESEANIVLGLSSRNLNKLVVRIRTTGSGQSLSEVNKKLIQAKVNVLEGIDHDDEGLALDTRLYACLMKAIENSAIK